MVAVDSVRNPLFTPQEGADFLRIHYQTMHKLIKRKEIKTVKVGSRDRISAEALMEYLQRSNAPVPTFPLVALKATNDRERLHAEHGL